MKRQIIDHTAITTAKPDAVFDRLLETTTWPEWSGHFSGKVLESAATPGAVGELREFRIGKKVSVERVVESTRPRRFSYVLVSGLPIHDYRADVDIEPVAGGTRIRWHSEFYGDKPLYGPLVQKGLGRFIKKIVRSLAEQCDEDVSGAASTTPSTNGAVEHH
jgi:polyketide cyclase/dehydrase/lipid transport protein